MTGSLHIIAEAAAGDWIEFDAVVHRLHTKTHFRGAASVIATGRRQASQNPDLP